MQSRKEQIRAELDGIRQELLETAKDIRPEEFAWEPRPGMKSAKGLLQEIGVMERLHTLFLTKNELADWESAVSWSGEGVEDILGDLQKIRQETLTFLAGCSEEDFASPRAIPEPWQQWWGTEASPEAMLRWIARHEYYHLGQLIYNRWLLGYNPYETGA
jgi:uncharacterized damage-inducible protein DinB